MKILLASHFFPPTHTGGTETRTLGYALELMDLGHEVQVICAGDWERGDRYWNGFQDDVYRGIPVRRINLNWIKAADPNRFLYDNPILEAHFSAWLGELQPDIVHITSCLTLSASIIRAVKRHPLPLLVTLTDYWFICPKINLVKADGELCDGITTVWDCLQCNTSNSGLYRMLDTVLPETWTAAVLQKMSEQPALSRLRSLRGLALDMGERKRILPELISQADMITTPSAYLGKVFAAAGIDQPIHTIHSGHDLSWLASMPERKTAKHIRFGYIGQLIPTKGVHVLLAAFTKHGLSDQAQLLIYGDPHKNPAYTAQLQSLSPKQDSSVDFLGKIPHEKLGEAFANIDVLIVPSIWHENNPRVIQEAFASQTPVIAANVGGISEFVKHEVNGLLYQHDDASDLASQIERIIRHSSLLRKLQAGTPPVKTMDVEVAEYVDLYRQLVYKPETMPAVQAYGRQS